MSGSGEEPIPISNVQREGLRCLSYSPKPLPVGGRFRQDVDFERRWDLMQQHTGQHLLSAIMNKYDNLNTVGWGMGSGDDMNYVDLPRKPTAQEMDEIQARCNEVIAQSLPITIDVQGDQAKKDRLPGDYDQDKGVIRAIRIGDIDTNT
jgi:misacylated tRNA(Ala) deacylase